MATKFKFQGVPKRKQPAKNVSREILAEESDGNKHASRQQTSPWTATATAAEGMNLLLKCRW
jgi:hypothetical protein